MRVPLLTAAAVSAVLAVLVPLAAQRPASRPAGARALRPIRAVELQPFKLHTQRIAEALELLGAPLPAPARARLDSAQTVEALQAVLDPLVLLDAHINPEQRVK